MKMKRNSATWILVTLGVIVFVAALTYRIGILNNLENTSIFALAVIGFLVNLGDFTTEFKHTGSKWLLPGLSGFIYLLAVVIFGIFILNRDWITSIAENDITFGYFSVLVNTALILFRTGFKNALANKN